MSRMLSFFGNYFYAKYLLIVFFRRYWWSRKTCNLIEWELMLVDDLKFWESNYGKSFAFIKYPFFWTSFNLPVLPYIPCQGTRGKNSQVSVWLGIPWQTKQKQYSQMLLFLGEKQIYWWIPYKDIDQRILNSTWTIVFWPLTSEPEFSWIWGLHKENRKL